jgi:diphthine-ammonia ligase
MTITGLNFMRVVGLVSGGKDSCFNLMHCSAFGHEIVAIANLFPVGLICLFRM